MNEQLYLWPSAVLREKCEPVTREEAEGMQQFIDVMLAAMHKHQGIGLAANQLGHSKQLFVMDGDAYFNPKIVKRSTEMVIMIEGCLSFPGKDGGLRRVRTKRAKEIDVIFHDRDFVEVVKTLTGIPAIVFQHEYDHLQGKTFLDREFLGRA